MTIVVNGEQCEFATGTTVADLAAARGIQDGRGCAVAVDGVVIPRATWSTETLRDGQSVELVHAVQGG